MTDAEIASEVLDRDSDNESEAGLERKTSFTSSQAYEAFGAALERLESQADIDNLHFLLVKKWKDIAAQN